MATPISESEVNTRISAGAMVFGYVPCGPDYKPCAEIIYVEAANEAEGFELMQVFIETGRVTKAPFYRMDTIKQLPAEEVAS